MHAPLRSIFFVFAGLSLLVPNASAQVDEAAKRDLRALREAYEAGGELDADVTLTIEFPEQPEEIQRGHISQSGERYRVEFDQQVVISDGETVWLYMPDNREVQVYDAEEAAGTSSGGSFIRPQDFLTIYENDGFEYAYAAEPDSLVGTQRQIEFKPLDRDSEYSKVRLTYDPASEQVDRVKIFNKDGSKFTLSLAAVNAEPTFEDGLFSFSESEFPGVRVEDMRL